MTDKDFTTTCFNCGEEDDGTFRYVNTKEGIILFCSKDCFNAMKDVHIE